ncbi:MAG: hypothetical protein BGO70_10790 [Bacteroidetes bacterium 43-93]|nr:PAS domain S-box protein [Bacteroidota bacterium]OJW95602.1 MAG: hypothetical protein BGO70_10790 [Bacteroidetes bacterium 43-93]
MKKQAIIFTLTYLLFGAAWIYYSDRLLEVFPPEQRSQMQLAKGLLFVCITGAILFLMLKYFYTEQKKRIVQLEANKAELAESARRYELLFTRSPLPKMIFDTTTLRFLDVNRQAVRHYGYSREQFLQMTIKDIRPEEDRSKLFEILKNRQYEVGYKGNSRHKKANGEIIYADVVSHSIDYNGQPARVVSATDVTERVKYIEAIEKQNQQLRDISWTQSHVVRAPLASLMGLVKLMNSKDMTEEEKEMVQKGILESAEKLDQIIKNIVKDADAGVSIMSGTNVA